MGRKNKKGIALLYTIISILLSIMLITTGIHAVNKLFKKPVDNNDELGKLVQISDQMLADTSFSSQSDFFELGTKELFMFFSSGTSSIFLQHKSEPDLYLEFARPDLPACKDKSCVCYCNEGPYWRTIDTEPYLQKHLLNMGEPYTCANPTCEKVDGNVIFTNSRGYDSFTKEAINLKKQYNDDKTYSEDFFPIPMDIPLLIQSEYKDDGNLFFTVASMLIGGEWTGDDYHQAYQDNNYVNYLVGDFFWKGGVVIGGTGYANSKDDFSDHTLSGPKITLVLKQPLEDKNIIGVCLEHKDCIVQEQLTSLENNLHIMEVKQQLLDLTNQLDSYSQQHLVPCMQHAAGLQQANDCVDSFQPLLVKLFNKVPQGYNAYAETVSSNSDTSSLINFYLKNSAQTDYTKLAMIHLNLPKIKILKKGKLPDSFVEITGYEKSKGFILSTSSTKRYNLAAVQVGSGKDSKFVIALRSLEDEKASEGK